MYTRTWTRGFSLIEILISIAIFGVIIAVYSATANAVYLTRDARHADVALKVANHKLEDLRAGGYAALLSGGSFLDSLMSTLPNATSSYTVADFNAKTKAVTVAVSWQDPGKSTRSVTLSTLVTQIGGI
jgi:prepilin-type N-terminal cleavage/methylation domain-containing protein